MCDLDVTGAPSIFNVIRSAAALARLLPTFGDEAGENFLMTEATCEARIKIRHYRNLYSNRPDPIDFIPLTVDTTGRLYDDFIRLLLLHVHREASDLDNELTEESDQFRFLRAPCFTNLKGTVGLIMVKESVIRISVPLDLSSHPFIPLPRFIRSRRPTPILAPSLVLFPPRSA